MFVHYHQPDGRRTLDFIKRPDAISDMADKIHAAGYQLDIEILLDGMISMTCTHPVTEECLSHEICSNGPDVLAAVDKLITCAAEQIHAA